VKKKMSQTKRNYKMNNFDGTLIQANPLLFGETIKNIPREYSLGGTHAWAPGEAIANLPSVLSILSGPSRTLSPEANTPLLDAFPIVKKILTGR
jgi:hypothetical protein